MAVPKGAFYREFGRRLFLARRKAKITQEALARALGLSRTSIVNIEKGRQPVQIDVAVRMAMSLGTTVSELLPEVNSSSVGDIASQLRKISPNARPWVERVITGSTLEKENENDSQIFTGKEKGTRTSPLGRRNKSPRAY